jgi:hypothetical protein
MDTHEYTKKANRRTAIIEKLADDDYSVAMYLNENHLEDPYSGAYHDTLTDAQLCADIWVNDGSIILRGELCYGCL